MELLYGVIIFAVDYFMLSQSTHLTDRQVTAIPFICIRSYTL